MPTEVSPADSIEVSIFGPGKGESIAVNLGDNRWIIVDSCIDQRSRVNPALEYLQRRGVDVATSVRLVVATHIHDDHFAGISDVLRACNAATFVCPSALNTPDFFALTDTEERVHAGLPKRAYAEFRKIFGIIEERQDSAGFQPLRYAFEQRPLLDDDGSGLRAQVVALSPSDRAFTRAQRALAQALPKVDEPKRIQTIDPNELAVAIWAEVDGKTILLGADLTTGPAGCGWQAVLATFNPSLKAKVFKVSHHGSITGHHDDVWTNLLEDSPVALLTPYRGGKNPVPNRSEIQSINARTSDAYITADPRLPAPSRSARKEAATLGPLAKNIRELWGACGQARAMTRIGRNDWTVDYFPPARRLSSLTS
jgi:hypothetical protein